MTRRIILFPILLLLAGCSYPRTYHLVTPSEVKGIPADSLKWSYSNGVVTEIAVRTDKDEIMRLPVDEETQLQVITTEREEHFFRLKSIVVDDKGDGLLGATTSWRGYDTRQGAERSVMIREVAEMKVRSRTLPSRRILAK